MKKIKFIISISVTLILLITTLNNCSKFYNSYQAFVNPSSTYKSTVNNSNTKVFLPKNTFMRTLYLQNYFLNNSDFLDVNGSYIASNYYELKLLDNFLNIKISDYFSNISADEKDDYYYFISLFPSIKSEYSSKLNCLVQEDNKLYFRDALDMTFSEYIEYTYNKITNKDEPCGGYLEKYAYIAAIPKSNIDISKYDELMDFTDDKWILANSLSYDQINNEM